MTPLLEAAGRQAHGAHVHAGENAADKLIDALIDLRQLETMIPIPATEALNVMEAAAKINGADGPTARQTMQKVTVHLGNINGGISSNLVPSSATAGLDIRIPLGLSAIAVQTAAAKLLSKHTSITWTIERLYEPNWTETTSYVAQACLHAAEDVMGTPAWFDMRIGGSAVAPSRV